VAVCLAVGKGLAGGSAISGPATMSVVCWGAAAWLLRHHVRTPLRHALHWLAASAALTIGIAQLYLGHPLPALLASWLVGALVLGALALLARGSGGARLRTHE
jgi:O-antigen/teichoic acid export membrane protein